MSNIAEKKVVTIDLGEHQESKLASITLNKSLKNTIMSKEYEILRLKSRIFTKEYDSKNKLINILPFFIDVSFSQIPQEYTLEKEYSLPSGSIVRIYKEPMGVGFIYAIKVPETALNLKMIQKIHDDFMVFQKEGKTDNEHINRWYLSYGILTHILEDDNVLEVNINPPGFMTPMRIIHSEYMECSSNVLASDEYLNSIATRLKTNTGRPLNKAQPQLDGEISFGNIRARVAAIVEPFSVFGTGYSIRKHREKPWTLPLFMKKGMIDPWFSGLMSFCITHGRAFLTAGPRGSGKTALLGSLLLEILPKYRILTIEDTQELPINSYKELGYDLLPLKVRSALLKEGMEMPFDMGLRTSLRLGDSCLIIGEIRSKEAKVLYESMRVGAMANVVAGTIHGDSPYGVYDRVVNDLGVPKGSFKVTDLIVVVNQIKSPTGLSRQRRVLKVTEVRKDWQDEPKFQDLLVYNPQKDILEPTEFLLKGKSVVINDILSRTRGYKNYNDAIEDIKLRAWAKTLHMGVATDPQLEAHYVAKFNMIFANLYEKILPLQSPSHMERFKQEYMREIKRYLKENPDVSTQESDEVDIDASLDINIEKIEEILESHKKPKSTFSLPFSSKKTNTSQKEESK
ncbi:MAG: ATPase, T2SS/T4P/T4SS family [Nanoarchaeota archaeon]|nr:ATPase, T2SS/T4P/T4SS family [Nanoarchaeota archaeon]MEC8339145.1 ATPase, T2SS/T4P/T4SS family [Nanoarchaeota archaeon]